MTEQDGPVPPKQAGKKRTDAIARRKALRRDKRAATPEGATALHAAATAAHKRADYDKALKLWAAFRQAAPGDADGFKNAIRTARMANRADAANQLAQDAAASFPDQAEQFRKLSDSTPGEIDDAVWLDLSTRPPADCALELAAAAAPLTTGGGGKRRYKLALSRVETVEQRYPEDVRPCLLHLELLRKLERLDKAAKFAASFRKKFPDDQELALSHVAILDRRKEFAAAFTLISDIRGKTKLSASIEVTYIQILSQLGRLDEAEAACAAALSHFPNSRLLMGEHAALATRRGDWTEALARWQAAKQIFPDNLKIAKGLTAARMQLADQELSDADLPQDETGQLFARFESLGGTLGGCEFGIVQRKFGSISLGALRWATIGQQALTTGMLNGFEGLGEIANTQLKTYKASGDREEYIVSDTTYGLGSHTFINPKDVPADKMLIQTAKRLKFLRGKLLEDLQEAEKIFVYKFHAPVDDAAIRSVFEAARTRGNVTMLCVLKANDANPKGTLRRIDDHLFAAYLGHFMSEGPVGENSFIDYMTWKDICTKMLEAQERK